MSWCNNGSVGIKMLRFSDFCRLTGLWFDIQVTLNNYVPYDLSLDLCRITMNFDSFTGTFNKEIRRRHSGKGPILSTRPEPMCPVCQLRCSWPLAKSWTLGVCCTTGQTLLEFYGRFLWICRYCFQCSWPFNNGCPLMKTSCITLVSKFVIWGVSFINLVRLFAGFTVGVRNMKWFRLADW